MVTALSDIRPKDNSGERSMAKISIPRAKLILMNAMMKKMTPKKMRKKRSVDIFWTFKVKNAKKQMTRMMTMGAACPFSERIFGRK
jgi:hypothetical protein